MQSSVLIEATREIIRVAAPEELELVEQFHSSLSAPSSAKRKARALQIAVGEWLGLLLPVAYWLLTQVSEALEDQIQEWIRDAVRWKSGELSPSEAYRQLMAELEARCLEQGLDDDDVLKLKNAFSTLLISKPELIKSLSNHGGG